MGTGEGPVKVEFFASGLGFQILSMLKWQGVKITSRMSHRFEMAVIPTYMTSYEQV